MNSAMEPTINSKVAQCGTGCPLHFDVWVFKEEKNGTKRVPINRPDI